MLHWEVGMIEGAVRILILLTLFAGVWLVTVGLRTAGRYRSSRPTDLASKSQVSTERVNDCLSSRVFAYQGQAKVRLDLGDAVRPGATLYHPLVL